MAEEQIQKLEDIGNKQDHELVGFLQKLVQIESWGGETDDEGKIPPYENELVDYLEDWIKKNTNLQVERQRLDGGRYNLIAKIGEPEIVFLAHTDTVRPSVDAPYALGTIKDGEIWGRGTSDMKQGIATMLQAISLPPRANNVWVFLYADEEYDFLGMKALVRDYKHIRPKLVVSSDGSDLRFGHGCRGLIEFRGRFVGKTGHPARSGGNSAIKNGFGALEDLREYALGYKHDVMGGTSFNVAHVFGGALGEDSIAKNGRLVRVGQAGNVVPDVMEFVLDVRPATPELRFENLVEKVTEAAENYGLKFELVERTHSYGAWFTKVDEVAAYTKAASTVLGLPVKFENPGASGYVDLQMFWDAVDRPPAFMFGSGIGATAHAPDERIRIADLIKGRNFFAEILDKRID